MQEGLRLDQVNFYYGEQHILQDISLNIPKGQFTLVVGPNGSGKTTLLRLIGGLLEPHSGTITLDGLSPDVAQQQGAIHLVPQIYNKNAAQFPATVREVVGLPLHQYEQAERSQRLQDALTLVGMNDFADRRIGALSGGQQQRVMLAQALARKPKYILLDEPTSGIDFETSEQLYNILHSLGTEGITIMMVTHDLLEAAKVADAVLCINGHTCYHGTCEGFLDSHHGSHLAWHIGG